MFSPAKAAYFNSALPEERSSWRFNCDFSILGRVYICVLRVLCYDVAYSIHICSTDVYVTCEIIMWHMRYMWVDTYGTCKNSSTPLALMSYTHTHTLSWFHIHILHACHMTLHDVCTCLTSKDALPYISHTHTHSWFHIHILQSCHMTLHEVCTFLTSRDTLP